MIRREVDGAAESAGDHFAAALAREDGAAVEGIEQHLLPRHASARDEMAGEPDAFHLETEPPTHVDEDEGQGDGNAEPPIQHLVEVAVPRIAVLLGVPREALLLEEALAEPVKLAEGIGGALRRARPALESLEPVQIRTHVEIGILAPRDDERRPGERDLGIGHRDLTPEFGSRVAHSHQQPGAWWMPAVWSAAACSSSASARVRPAARRASSCASGVVAHRKRSDRPSSWWNRSSGSITSR